MRLKCVVYNKTRKLAGITIFLNVNAEDRIEHVKRCIENETKVPVDVQWIVFGVTHLSDGNTLADYGICDGYTIYCTPTTVEIADLPNL